MMLETQELQGGSVWVEDNDTAKYFLESVELFQKALIILAGKM
jgi:hypothetical protein